MSALAHYLEDEGIATVCISLIRLHSERMRPPRSLFVPFELGRPLGEPNDRAFQRDVLAAALRLLAESDRPGSIADYPYDAPGERDDPDWESPLQAAAGQPADQAGERRMQDSLLAEIESVRPLYDAARGRSGRTTVGLARMPLEACAAYLCGIAAGRRPQNPVPDRRDALTMRFAVDDLKAYYLEALRAGPGRPSSRQLTDWFWDRTVAARVICRARESCLAGNDRVMRMVAKGKLLSRYQLHRLGLD